MKFSGVAQPDTSDITSRTKFTAHFNRPSAQQARRQATKSQASPALRTMSGIPTAASEAAGSDPLMRQHSSLGAPVLGCTDGSTWRISRAARC